MDDTLCFLLAAATGDTTTLKNLYHSNKRLLSSTNPDGRTALHLAAYNQQPETLQLLLSYGICGAAKDKCGHTALHIAAQGTSTVAADILLRNGAGCGLRDNHGHLPIFYAYDNPNPDMLARFQASAPDCGAGCALTPEIVLKARASERVGSCCGPKVAERTAVK
ncbi:cortactin-binding protein [Aspergillus karnatakaensis]|uniref:ankyrin repeat domain-containing protein n=1 Tax=Aspergillus karnatakaensis TaxID=1810916 RepID=UPI003CCE3753